MLYFVMLQDKILFKGNFYKCLEYVESLEVGADKVKITARK
jgi:hypothetical protein